MLTHCHMPKTAGRAIIGAGYPSIGHQPGGFFNWGVLRDPESWYRSMYCHHMTGCTWQRVTLESYGWDWPTVHLGWATMTFPMAEHLWPEAMDRFVPGGLYSQFLHHYLSGCRKLVAIEDLPMPVVGASPPGPPLERLPTPAADWHAYYLAGQARLVPLSEAVSTW